MRQELHDYMMEDANDEDDMPENDCDVNFLHVVEDNNEDILASTVKSENSTMSFKYVYASNIQPVISTMDKIFTRSI